MNYEYQAAFGSSTATRCGLKNDLAKLDPRYKEVKIRILKPPIDLGDSLNFEQANIQRMEKIGYDAACKLV